MKFSFSKIVLLCCFFLFTNTALKAQTIVRYYLSGINNEHAIKIIENEYGIELIYVKTDNDKWVKAIIIACDIPQEYVKIVTPNDRTKYELIVDWKFDKLILINEFDQQEIFWLKTQNT